MEVTEDSQDTAVQLKNERKMRTKIQEIERGSHVRR